MGIDSTCIFSKKKKGGTNTHEKLNKRHFFMHEVLYMHLNNATAESIKPITIQLRTQCLAPELFARAAHRCFSSFFKEKKTGRKLSSN